MRPRIIRSRLPPSLGPPLKSRHRSSMDLRDWIKAEVAALDRRARPFVERGPWHRRAYEVLLFGLKEAWACMFGAVMLALLLGTHLFYPAHAPLARYDFLVLAAVAVQALLLALKLEHWAEARVIFIFHVVGTLMELFKTAHGSWIYPEPSVLRIGGVPLFSGFMYACVGSYIARAIRILDLRISHYPPSWSLWLLALLAYANFFTHHYLPDIRWGLFAMTAVMFWRSLFWFKADRKWRALPVLPGFVLTAVFIWIAENLGTFAGAWTYPSQHHHWRLVAFEKVGSWYLLMLLSFVLVTLVHRIEPVSAEERAAETLAA
jgi:uncharacterized membrane protein YoaT (DUF817 family)